MKRDKWEIIKESAMVGAAAVVSAFIFWFLLVVVFLFGGA